MERKTKIALTKAKTELDELEKLLTDRIAENNRAKEVNPGIMIEQANHAYMLYRNKVWKAKYILRDLLEASE